jgi:hypothetical protein
MEIRIFVPVTFPEQVRGWKNYHTRFQAVADWGRSRWNGNHLWQTFHKCFSLQRLLEREPLERPQKIAP